MTSLDYQVLSRRIYSNFPVIGWLLRRWAAWQLAKDDGSGEAVAILAEVVTRGQDRAVREMALTVLNRLKTQDAINGFCRVWVETRHKDLAAILRSRRYVATEPRLRVLSALKVGALDVVKRGGVEVLDFLLAALNDRDTQVATMAASCVSALENRVVIDELCRRWVENPNPQLESIIRKGNYAPDEVSSRALFYFLLGEWQKYEDLDFDHSLLAKAYQSANKEVQGRCTDKAKIGGRIEWVKILTNTKRGLDVENMTDKDWEAFVDILEVHPEKKELWNFLYNAPVIWSKRLLDKLSKGLFKGFNQDQKSALKSLFDLVKNITDEEFISAFLYLFIREPEYQVLTNQVLTNPTEWDLGRTYYRSPKISPNGKMLALNIGEEHKIELRSLPDGKHIKTISSSTSKFIFSHDSCILISVHYGDEYNICLWSLPDGNFIKSLTGHTGRVNSLVISNDGKMLLSGSSDGTVILWSLPSGTLIEVIPMIYREYNGNITILVGDGHYCGGGSVESLAISSDNRLLVVRVEDNQCYTNVILYDLLNKKYLGKSDINGRYREEYKNEVYPKPKFLKEMRQALLAYANYHWSLGEIIYMFIEECAISPNDKLLVRNIIHTHKADYPMSFWSLPDGRLLKTIASNNDKFFGKSISPDGQTLIAIRERFLNGKLEHAIFSLNLSDINTPLSKFTNEDISKIEKIRDSKKIRECVCKSLEFMLSLIRLRQQFDIDIEDVSSDVQFSEFNIEIDG